MSFTTEVTRPIAQGDTPSILNQKTTTLPIAASTNLIKGQPCVVITGNVTAAVVANTAATTNAYVVPVESVDNSSGGDGDLNIKVVTVGPETGPYVALTSTEALTPFAYVEIGASSVVELFGTGAKYAQYIGKEAGVWSRAAGSPYDQTLSDGQVPVQPLEIGEVGWFRIMENTN